MMYCTLKIKTDKPFRPLKGQLGTMYRSLADLLAPIVGKTSHHTKNSNWDREMFLSHDVVAINETLDGIKRQLEDTNLKHGQI